MAAVNFSEERGDPEEVEKKKGQKRLFALDSRSSLSLTFGCRFCPQAGYANLTLRVRSKTSAQIESAAALGPR